MKIAGGTYVFLVALVAAAGGFLFGFDLSIASGALPFLKERFGLDAAGEGLAMSSAIFGSIAGPLAGMWLADRLGRRTTLWVAAACFLASAIGTALPRTITEFNVWRAVGGVGVGLAAMTSPMYIAELAPPRLRGRLVTVNQLAIVIGINLAVISSWLLSFGGHWRWMFASEIPAIIALMAGLVCVPESPRWLAARGRDDEALDVLGRINGPEAAARELAEIRADLGQETASLAELFQPGIRTALAVGIVLMIYQQVNGVNMMLLYGPSILQNAGIGSASDAIFFTIFLNLFILAATLVAFGLVKRFGRRPIIMTGVTGMAAGHVLMAVNFFRGGSPFVNLAAMILAAGSFTLSLAPVAWIVVAEIYPTRIRATALAVVCCLLYLASFLCAQCFPMLTAACEARMGHPGAAYLLFAGICLSCAVFVWRWLPETKDLPLERIGRFWLERA
ncbi:MAG: sugar porter family MFS transporter [Planctomycetaceae bacterium]